MLDNATLAADLAPLIEQLAGTTPNPTNESAFATALTSLLNQWNVQVSTGALSSSVTELTQAVQRLLTQFNAFPIKGTVQTVSALASVVNPGVGDTWVCTSNGHGYAYLIIGGNPIWQDVGQMQGPAGPAGTVGIGTVTTGGAGSSAAVTNSGSSSAAVLNFTIPQGQPGTAGYAGWSPVLAAVSNGAGGFVLQVTSWEGGQGTAPAAGQFVGSAGLVSTAAAAVNIQGPAATVAIGTVTTGAAGSSAAVTNSGSSTSATLNFTIPQGQPGSAATVSVGSVTTGSPGSSAAVTNAGSTSAAVLNFSLPQGAPGTAATVAIGTVTTGAPGSSAAVTNSGSANSATLNFSIPQGQVGPQPWANPAAWASNTAYIATAPASTVTNAGSSYVCTTSHTSGSTFDATKWQLIAAAGQNGTGAGNVNATGPFTAGHFAVFADATGDVIQDGGALSQFLTGNQTITLSGDATGSGTTALTVTLAATGVPAGTYGRSNLTFDAKGRLTAATANPITSAEVTTALSYTPENPAHKGSANGYAPLDSTSKVPLANLPAALAGDLRYMGTWNASTNSPALTSGSGTSGQFYKVATAGTTTLNGVSTWSVGDMVLFDGTTWDKLDGQATEVVSVAGRVGAITLTHADLTDWATATSGFAQTSSLGTAASLNAGTSANNLVQLNGSGALPAISGANLTGLTSTQIGGLGTAAALNAGTSANNLVQVQTGGKLPALDGSQLTNLPSSAPTASQIDTALGFTPANQTDLSNTNADLAVLTYLAIAQDAAVEGLDDGFADDFQNENGIDTANSPSIVWSTGIVSNKSTVTASSYSSSSTVVPVMAADTGTGSAAGYIASSAGESSGSSAAYMAFDGSSSTYYASASKTLPEYISIKLAAAKAIGAYQWATVSGGAANYTWQFQGSNDGSSWTTLDTQTTVAMSTSLSTFVMPSANVGSYQYYRLYVTAISASDYLYVTTLNLFQNIPGLAACTLQSLAPITLTAGAPSNGALYVKAKLGSGAVLNTDITGSLSRDGATFTAGTFTSMATFSDGSQLLKLGPVSLSSQPSGATPKYKVSMSAAAEIDVYFAEVREA